MHHFVGIAGACIQHVGGPTVQHSPEVELQNIVGALARLPDYKPDDEGANNSFNPLQHGDC